MPTTLYWHDYEIFSTDPKRDRPAQVTGLHTDEDLKVRGAPLLISKPTAWSKLQAIHSRNTLIRTLPSPSGASVPLVGRRPG